MPTKDDKLDLKTFAGRLRALRESRGEKQRDLADEIGVTRAAISQYEKNLTLPTRERIESLVSHFGVSQDWLMSGTGPTPVLLGAAKHHQERFVIGTPLKEFVTSGEGAWVLPPYALAAPPEHVMVFQATVLNTQELAPIQPGDFIYIDMRQTEVTRAGIWLGLLGKTAMLLRSHVEQKHGKAPKVIFTTADGHRIEPRYLKIVGRAIHRHTPI